MVARRITRSGYGRPMTSRRDAAHVLLDAVTAFDPALGDDPANEAAVALAFERLGLSDEAYAQARPMLGAALDLLVTLVYVTAQNREADPAAVVAAIRAHVDENVYNDLD